MQSWSLSDLCRHRSGMLLTDLLTLTIISCNCVSLVSNETLKIYKCALSSKCCTRNSSSSPFAPFSKLTSLLEVPDVCYLFHEKFPPLPRKVVLRNSTFENATIFPSFGPFRPPSAKRPFLNSTARFASNIDDSESKAARREEFRRLRFHFGREVPVVGICMCVAFDCALIALTCAVLNNEDLSEDDQEAEEFESIESLHGRLMREVQTQTLPERQKTYVDKSVQTDTPYVESTEERRTLKSNSRHQSDC
ncbi:hypothetical protein RB195_009699 [Necator americanus]|uniref:Uncharacterized protein n=1 Tax=Necator americanus TaxID=51031 RepID=A0ABR1CUH1_NECAM